MGKETTQKRSIWSYVESVFPGIRVLRSYQWSWLRNDIIAGVTVFALLVPSALAYAELAGLPPVTGLSMAVGAMLCYAFLARLSHVVVGPEATAAILTASTVAPLAGRGDSLHYAVLSASLAIIVGLLIIVCGLLRLGFLSDFLSKPMLLGYINGTTLVVIVGQLGKIFGIKLESKNFFPQLWELVTHLGNTHLLTCLIGLSLVAGLFLLRFFAPKVPGALIIVILATLASAVFHLSERGVTIVGAIPGGVPLPKVPLIGFSDIIALLPGAIGIVFVSFADGILTARTFASKNHYRLHVNRELIALGGAQIGAGLFQGFPCGSSQSRTAVSDSMGGKTQLVSLVATALALLFLLFFTFLLQPLPVVALAACIIVASSSMLNFTAIYRVFKIRPIEGVLSLVTFFGVLTIGIMPGILVAGMLALINVISAIAHPHDAVLGHEQGVDGYHEIYASKDCETTPGLIVYRFDAPLFYANANYFKNQVRTLIEKAHSDVRWLLINAEPITDIDVTAAEMLKNLNEELAQQEIKMVLARVSYPLHRTLERTGLAEMIGEKNFYPTVTAGAQAFQSWISKEGPLTHFSTRKGLAQAPEEE